MKKAEKIAENLYLVVLMLYPLRHIHMGLDLMDTGYSYANFTYMGLDHMDSMWLFSTYLANALGHLITLLPFADSMVGMNLYTGLFVSGLAVAGYFFCTRTLGMGRFVAFLGEMTAISLCWCPTAKLYDYLGYVLFLACVILLYRGLTEEKLWCLVAAGACLGTNIFVRFSNLPQAALIVAVWVYAALVERERSRGGSVGVMELVRNSFRRALGATECCLGGYLAAVVVWFGYLHIRYGLPLYFQSIRRLFAMTDTASDYKASAMLYLIAKTYLQNSYWLIRMGMLALAGVLVWCVVLFVTEHFEPLRERKTLQLWLYRGLYVCWGGVALWMVWWLWSRKFFSFYYYSYDSMILPGILFLMLSMLIAAIHIFRPGSSKEEKLLGGLVILVILLTSIGSNNGVYPSLNNLFVAAPYTLWECTCFVRGRKEYRWGKWKLALCAAPVKGVLCAYLGIFLVQSLLFGAVFVFAEGTGIRNPDTQVQGNPVLRGVVMSEEKAGWLQEISDYVEEEGLRGREVLLYGQVPGLSYYLQMPAAFNPWCDLTSYKLETMEEDLDVLREQMESGEEVRPVIIAEHTYAQYEDGNRLALVRMGLSEEAVQGVLDDPKWRMITDFMRDFEYEKTFENEKFAIWE